LARYPPTIGSVVRRVRTARKFPRGNLPALSRAKSSKTPPTAITTTSDRRCLAANAELAMGTPTCPPPLRSARAARHGTHAQRWRRWQQLYHYHYRAPLRTATTEFKDSGSSSNNNYCSSAQTKIASAGQYYPKEWVDVCRCARCACCPISNAKVSISIYMRATGRHLRIPNAHMVRAAVAKVSTGTVLYSSRAAGGYNSRCFRIQSVLVVGHFHPSSFGVSCFANKSQARAVGCHYEEVLYR
jgi:hypothetical protein